MEEQQEEHNGEQRDEGNDEDNNPLEEEEENNNNIDQPEPPPLLNPVQFQLNRYQEQVAALAIIADAEESFLGTITSLNHQNRRLESKINEADAQNNLLQMQLKVLSQKMENLEIFMHTINEMNELANRDEQQQSHRQNNANTTTDTIGKADQEKPQQIIQNCPKCGFDLKKNLSESLLRRSESFDREVYADLLPESCFIKKKPVLESEDGTNPMMIDLIIAKIMDHLPTPSLLKCRSVHSLWNHEASYRLSQRHTFKLNFANIEQISEFTASPSTSWPLFTKIKIDLGFVVNPFRSYLEDFFRLYGPTLTHLSLSCEEEFANRLYTEELRAIFLGYLSNIEELELSLPTKITERPSLYEDPRPRARFLFPKLKSLILHQFDNSGGYNVWFTKELLRMAPNLGSLRVETHNREVMTRILLALGDRETRSICSQLKHLYLDAYVTEQHLQMLSQFDFQLASLQLSLLTVDVTKEAVESFLNRHRSSLETLILGDYMKRPSVQGTPLTLRLPVMGSLTKIKFVDPCFPDQRNILLTPLSFPVQTPKLRSLSFEHEAGKPSGIHVFGDLFNPSFTPFVPCRSLRELKISHGLTDSALIAQAAAMFPNLTSLHVANVGDGILKEIWTHFHFLEEFGVGLCPSNVNVDSIFTGIPFEVCKKIQERNLYAQVETLDVLDIIRTEPSICNMSKLRTLRIDGLPSTLLTAVSGYLALSQMKSLTSISIKSDVATLSRECRRVMGERLNLTLFDLF